MDVLYSEGVGLYTCGYEDNENGTKTYHGVDRQSVVVVRAWL